MVDAIQVHWISFGWHIQRESIACQQIQFQFTICVFCIFFCSINNGQIEFAEKRTKDATKKGNTLSEWYGNDDSIIVDNNGDSHNCAQNKNVARRLGGTWQRAPSHWTETEIVVVFFFFIFVVVGACATTSASYTLLSQHLVTFVQRQNLSPHVATSFLFFSLFSNEIHLFTPIVCVSEHIVNAFESGIFLSCFSCGNSFVRNSHESNVRWERNERIVRTRYQLRRQYLFMKWIRIRNPKQTTVISNRIRIADFSVHTSHSGRWQWRCQTLSYMLRVYEAKTRDVFSYEKRVFIRLHFVPHSHSLFTCSLFGCTLFLSSYVQMPHWHHHVISPLPF